MLNARKDIIGVFEKRTFLYKGNVFKIKEEESEEERVQKFIEYIDKESKDTNHHLFKDYFNFVIPSALAKKNIWNKI